MMKWGIQEMEKHGERWEKDGQRRPGLLEKVRSAFPKMWYIRAQKGVSLASFGAQICVWPPFGNGETVLL
jgi:hypothetical protein